MSPSERTAFLLRWRESIVAEAAAVGFGITNRKDLDAIDTELASLLETKKNDSVTELQDRA